MERVSCPKIFPGRWKNLENFTPLRRPIFVPVNRTRNLLPWKEFEILKKKQNCKIKRSQICWGKFLTINFSKRKSQNSSIPAFFLRVNIIAYSVCRKYESIFQADAKTNCFLWFFENWSKYFVRRLFLDLERTCQISTPSPFDSILVSPNCTGNVTFWTLKEFWEKSNV